MEQYSNGDVCYRKEDTRAEKISVEFLERYFYDKLNGVENVFVNKQELQRKGVDVLLRVNNGREFYVDNKSANLQWMNSALFNAAIELSFLVEEKDKYGRYVLDDDGHTIKQRVDGWFLNQDNITDIYLFYWVHLFEDNGFPYFSHPKKTDYFNDFVLTDIEYIEIMMVQKKELKSWCDRVGLTEGRLRYYNAQMHVKKSYTRNTDWIYNISDDLDIPIEGVVGIAKNNSYKERPILLILNHDIMTQLSFLHCNVFSDRIQDLYCPKREEKKVTWRLHD